MKKSFSDKQIQGVKNRREKKTEPTIKGGVAEVRERKRKGKTVQKHI